MKKASWVLRSQQIMENAIDGVIQAAKLEGRFAGGKLYRVIVEEYKPPKTKKQNRTLHMWINEIAEFVGDSPEAIKKWLKDDFWPKTTRVRFGKERVEPKSTADLTKEETIYVMTQVEALCAEYGIPLTEPDPLLGQGD